MTTYVYETIPVFIVAGMGAMGLFHFGNHADLVGS